MLQTVLQTVLQGDDSTSLCRLFPKVPNGKLKPVVSQSANPFIWNLRSLIADFIFSRSMQEVVGPVTIIMLQFPPFNVAA